MQRFSTFSSTLRTLRAPLAPSFRAYSTAPSSSEPVASTSSASAEAADAAADLQVDSEWPYYVPRTRFGDLPVYTDIKHGGSKVLTIVRKAEGDINALHRDLAAFLHPNAATFVKPANRQIVIQGEWVRETKEWLAAKGF
ncbi:hypothetical protein JCM6882_001240 [Rhodosporidiobolus microsporus]